MKEASEMCADCSRSLRLVNDACRDCLRQRRLVFVETAMLLAITDEQRQYWAQRYESLLTGGVA